MTQPSPDQVLDTLETALAQRTAWDELPSLYVLGTADGALKLIELPIPDQLWRELPTAELPAYLAQVQGLRLRGHGLVAVAIRMEYFALWSDTTPVAHEVLRRRLAGGSTPPFAEVAGRLEERGFYAVSPQGDLYITTAVRNTDDSASKNQRIHQTASDPTPGDLVYQGTLIEGLRQLVATH